MTVKAIDYDFFDVLLENLKQTEGYVLFYLDIDAEAMARSFHFKNKEHFEYNFEYKSAFPYPGQMIVPRDIVEQYGAWSYDCNIDGEQYYIQLNNMYLVIDGVFQNPRDF